MKPNDKAIEALAKVIEDRLPEEGASGLSEFERQVLANDMAVDGLAAAYVAQFNSEEYAGLVEELRYECSLWLRPHCVKKAADAIEALLAERAAWKGRQEATAALLKQVETERDEWKKQAEIFHYRMKETEITLGKHVQENDKLVVERDALKSELASGHMWLQMRATVLVELAMVRAERDALAARLATVDDDALVEIAAVAIRRNESKSASQLNYVNLTNIIRAAIAAIRPHIEAVERERCAKVAEGFSSNRDWVPGSLWGNIRNEIAAAIRSGK